MSSTPKLRLIEELVYPHETTTEKYSIYIIEKIDGSRIIPMAIFLNLEEASAAMTKLEEERQT